MTTQTYTYTGPFHLFYVPGRTYELNIRETLFGRVKIECPRGYYAERTEQVTRKKYRNWEAFDAEWEWVI
jgi:hypothetical protein